LAAAAAIFIGAEKKQILAFARNKKASTMWGCIRGRALAKTAAGCQRCRMLWRIGRRGCKKWILK